MTFSFSLIHSTSSQSRHLRVYLQKFAIGTLHCTVIAVVGWHVAALVIAKVRVRTPVKPEAFFIRMSPAFTKFKWWELFVMSAWETYQLDRKLIFFYTTAINKLNEEVIAGLRTIGSFSRICSFKNFLGRGKTKLKRVTCPHYSQIQLGTMYFLSSLSSLA